VAFGVLLMRRFLLIGAFSAPSATTDGFTLAELGLEGDGDRALATSTTELERVAMAARGDLGDSVASLEGVVGGCVEGDCEEGGTGNSTSSSSATDCVSIGCGGFSRLNTGGFIGTTGMRFGSATSSAGGGTGETEVRALLWTILNESVQAPWLFSLFALPLSLR